MWACLIPGGKEAALFGAKTFASKIWVWAPGLVYTLINETTGNQQLAFISVAPWFAVGGLFIFFLDYEKGKRDVADTLHKRHGEFSCDKEKGAVAPVY